MRIQSQKKQSHENRKNIYLVIEENGNKKNFLNLYCDEEN